MKTTASLLALLAILSSSAFADSCYRSDTPKVAWTAFKTPEKIGVHGTFTQIEYRQNVDEATSIAGLLENARIGIDARTVDSGNKGRDKKLVTFFFGKMRSFEITGKVLSVQPKNDTQGTMVVSFTMNGHTQKATMPYRLEKDTLVATATLDLGGFGALDAVASLNKACYALHKGKTWSDVDIRFELPVTKDACTTDTTE